MAILWRTHLDMHVTCLVLDSVCLTSFKITIRNRTFVILCVYMPYELPAHEDLFLDNRDTIKAMI